MVEPRCEADDLPEAITFRDREKARRRVLLVDDEEALCRALVTALEGLGWAVEVAHDGRTGVACYRAAWQRIDLVLLDLSLPGLDGGEAFREMRRVNPGVVAVLITGFDLDEVEVADCRDMGFRGVLGKPFAREDLQRVMEQALGSQGDPVASSTDHA